MFARIRSTALIGLCLFLTAGALGAELPAGVKASPLQVPQGGQPGFTLMSGSQTGVLFTNELLPWPEATNQNLLNGAGLALGDYDGDGWCDIFLCNLNGSSRLFRNLGNWKFQDTTDASGLSNSNLLARGAVFADVNGDGALDLLVTYSGRGTRLFLNDGSGHFHDAQAAELVDSTGSMSMGLGDVNGDGTLDLYVANYGENTIRSGMKVSTRIVDGKEQITGRYRNRLKIIDGKLVEYGEPSALYLNDGRGKFRRVSWTDGTFRDERGEPLPEVPWELSFTVVVRDINQDGKPDMYVCNDFQDPDRLWLGDGHGGFRAIAREALRSTPHFSMAADFADINNDGLDDFFVTDMLSRSHELRMRQVKPDIPPIAHTREKAWDRPQVRRNFLFISRGDGTYADIANYAGVACSDWSWSTVFLDVDLDGYPDILVGTGHYYDTQDQDAMEKAKLLSSADKADSRRTLSLYPRLLTPNYAFHNLHNCTFEEVGRQWGFDSLEVSHSIGLADLDNDGDLDVVVNCLRAPALLYRNNSSAPRVAVRLKGLAPNTRGVGARIQLLGGAVPVQFQEVTCGSHFLAGDALERTFAAGTNSGSMSLEVTWRSGKRSIVPGVLPNYLYEIDESAAVTAKPAAHTPSPAPLFEDVSQSLGHRHAEAPYDDFARQPLLPRRLSQLGPGVAWCDLNGDGKEDLVIGGGRGSALGVYLNIGSGHWKALEVPEAKTLPEDTAGLVSAVLQPGKTSLLVGLAHYETDQTNLPVMLRFDGTEKGLVAAKAPTFSGVSTGPLALADIDGDGDLDLFVGGRLKAGRYPEPADSQLFRNEGGELIADEAASRLLAKAGLVTGAVFSDLNGDGFPDLILACEWGAPRVFLNDHGRFKEWDCPLQPGTPAPRLPGGVSKLSDLRGLWTCVATGDFDGDGRMDVVLGNWGLNCNYHQVEPGPWFLYYGDFNGDGSVQMFEAFRDASLRQVVPWRDLTFMEKALPWIRASFPTHKAYAAATLDQLLGEHRTKAAMIETRFLGSMLLLNRGEKFKTSLLPREAQWSPVMGIAVGDLDGDGNEDLFLSQNYFAVRSEDGRMDAGRGLWLRGDGKGSFTAVSGQESGIRVYGEQRGCALADYDGDGRLDLVVTQNNEETRLFHNVGAKPGLRVKLAGPPGNPDGIGALLRLDFGGRFGPVREIQAGSGFWSQNGLIQVLAAPEPIKAIEVRWPGGKMSRSEIPAGAKSIAVDASGGVRNQE